MDQLITGRADTSSCTSSVPGVDQAVLASANPDVSASPAAVVSAQDNGNLASITWNLDPASWEKNGNLRKYWIKWGPKPARSKMQMWQDNGFCIPFQRDLFFVLDVNYFVPVSSSRSQ